MNTTTAETVMALSDGSLLSPPLVTSPIQGVLQTERKGDLTLTLATAHQFLTGQEGSPDGKRGVEEKGTGIEIEDEEMEQTQQPVHINYVPHLWRSIPEHLWKVWRDMRRGLGPRGSGDSMVMCLAKSELTLLWYLLVGIDCGAPILLPS